ncbi:MAG: VOC family protein, partial [Terrimicrobiaceae bacterium]
MNDISPLNMNEPIFDVAQLAHVELLTPDLEGTLRFFKDLLGLEETERRAQSVYLHGYEEQYHHSLK